MRLCRAVNELSAGHQPVTGQHGVILIPFQARHPLGRGQAQLAPSLGYPPPIRATSFDRDVDERVLDTLVVVTGAVRDPLSSGNFSAL